MNKHQKYVAFVNHLFDEAKIRLGCKTDKELAVHLHEHNVDVSKYRKGTRVISDWKLLRLVKLADVDRLEALKKILLYKSLKVEVKEVILDLIDALSRNQNK